MVRAFDARRIHKYRLTAAVRTIRLKIGPAARPHPVTRLMLPTSAGRTGPCSPKWVNAAGAGISPHGVVTAVESDVAERTVILFASSRGSQSDQDGVKPSSPRSKKIHTSRLMTTVGSSA